jgi:hypothetical protein
MRREPVRIGSRNAAVTSSIRDLRASLMYLVKQRSEMTLIRHSFRAPVAVVTTSVAALALATPVLPTASAATVAAKALVCHASMSNSRPKDYTRTDVLVGTARGARVTTVAHYRTTSTTHRSTANAGGKADIPYFISGATPGYRVKVSVYVVSASRKGSCSTSFTPHR